MNARQQLKPKTIRLAILLALADGAIATIDDLQTRMDEPRARIASNVHPTAAEGLIKRLRDDVTSLPAYQITPKGREHLASFSGGKEEVAEIAHSVVNESLITEAEHAELKRGEAVALGILEEAMPGFTAEVVAQKDAEIARLTSQRNAWHEMAAIFSCESPNDIADRIRFLSEEFVKRAEPVGYVVKRPGKTLSRFTKADSAQANAMVSARDGKRAQVFALVPAGVAVPGAEWVGA